MPWVTTVLVAALVGATGDATRFRPPPATGLIGVTDALPLWPGQIAASATFWYARNPVVWLYTDGSYEPVVSSQLAVDLGLAIGLGANLDVGLSLPIALVQEGATTSLSGLPSERRSVAGAGLGDLRITPRLGLTRARSLGVAIALAADIALPTGDAERFRGEEGLAVTPRLATSVPLRAGDWPLLVGATVGYRVRKRAEVAQLSLGHELEIGAGAALELPTLLPLTALVEMVGTTAARKPAGDDGLLGLEARAGLRARVRDTVLTLSAAAGLTNGLGTPDFRIALGVAYAPDPADRDGDGIPDREDRCPDIPEDYDGFEDSDGCRDPDNDGDDIPDDEDRCPLDPEDRNDQRDDDGCPDEGIADSDGDGLYDDEDDCPSLPENRNGIEDDDGCPDADTDGDGIADSADECPEKKETINGIDDWDGCPDEGEGQTEYVAKVRIDIKATILFETNKATIKDESKPILDQVALQILSHPEVRRVRVEGHTDSVGAEEGNLYLSQDRADSVRRYLIGRGVGKERLVAIGYGETRPIASNTTVAGRAMNRRVEFVIVE